MERIPISGFYYSRELSNIVLQAFQEIIGEKGLNVLFRYAGIERESGRSPGDVVDKGFDFSSYSMLITALGDTYGDAGSRALLLRAGGAVFREALMKYGKKIGVYDPAFQNLPIPEKAFHILKLIAGVSMSSSDQLITIEDDVDHYRYIVSRCPICWGRKTAKPSCYLTVGLLEAGLSWATGGGKYQTTQITSKSSGGETCEFKIMKEPIL